MVRTLAAALASGTCIVALATPAAAQTREYNIPAGSLKDALDAYVRQSGRQIVYRADQVRVARSPGVRGSLSADAALTALLANSGFTTRVDGKLIAIVKVGKVGTVNSAASSAEFAQLPDSMAGDQGSEILVTGSRIRGGDTPSPTIRITARDIQEEGFSDLGDVIRSIPQNFSGGQNPGIAAGAFAGGRANQNITGGSGLNLRGLGPDASLTLLNGHRLSYDGFAQTVDISAIPVEAVERIEILTDGASAIYGTDAVGGVANVILKRDFTGLTASARYSTSTDGGVDTQEYAATAGATWSTGGLIATVKTASNDPLYADQRSFTESMFSPSTLYQKGTLYSGLVSAHQSVGALAQLHVDAYRSRRRVLTDTGYAATYERNQPTTDTFFVAPSVDISLPHDWSLTLGGALGRSRTDVDYAVFTFATQTSSLSRPYYRNKSAAYEIGAEGPLFALGGGDARLAIGAGYRRNTYISGHLGSDSISTNAFASSHFAYAELNLPLVGPSLGVPGVSRLEVSGALRAEDYNDAGRVTTPKLGLIYSPIPDFTLKASWGRSFKAPTLSEEYTSRVTALFPAAYVGGTGYASDATAIYYAGGNLDLKPERARTWSATIGFNPRRISRLNLELTWYDIDYTNRVVTPVGNPYQSLSNPQYIPFVVASPTSAQQSAAIAGSRFINVTGADYDPDKVVALINNIYTNTANQKIHGIDLSGGYKFDLSGGTLAVRGSISWMNSKRQISSDEEFLNLAGTLFYPAKVSGRVGAIWNRGGLTLSVFGNHKGGVINPETSTKGDSFTTVDATFQYETGERAGALSGLIFALSADNLFDTAPPLYETASSANAPYDSTNYSAIGRFLSFSLSKHF